MRIELIQKDANWIKVPDPVGQGLVYQILSYQKMMPGKDGMVAVTYSLYDGRRRAFPSGLLNKVVNVLASEGHETACYSIDHPRLTLKIANYNLPGIEYEDYQKMILRPIGILHKRGIIVAPTAAGKSIIIGGIIRKLSDPYKTLIVVPTSDILRQLRTNMIDWFGVRKVGQVGNGIVQMDHITVALYQSLDKIKFSKNEIKLVIIDEVHRINDTIINFLNRSGSTIWYRFGLTATPQKIDNNPCKALEMYGFVGPIVKTVEDDQVESRVIPAKVYMFKFINGYPRGVNFHKSYKYDILLNETRNKLFLKAVKKFALDQGKNALILLDEVEHLKMIEKLAIQMGLKPGVAHGKQKKMHNEIVKQDLNNGRINLVIATQVFGMGTNIPNLDCVAIASSRKSEIDTLQKIGRGRRRTANKRELIVIDSIDQLNSREFYHQHFYKYSLKRMAIYREKGWEISRILIL